MAKIIPFLEYLRLDESIKACVEGTTQSQAHIKPLHRHFAMRLVIEGGFLPEEITPRPPLEYRKSGNRSLLSWAEAWGSQSERTVMGGIKTKKIDVVVTKASLGPVMALSFKGTQNAFRNLTNRMEEAVGDCTNIHLRYPSLVYGFYHVILANRRSQVGKHRLVRSENDVSVREDGSVVAQVERYILAIDALARRINQWDVPSAYEAVSVHMVESDLSMVGKAFEWKVQGVTRLHRDNFLGDLLRIYDQRYPYMAESIRETRRIEWSSESPFFKFVEDTKQREVEAALGYSPRIG
jgi:hypothetical protein